MKMTNAEQWLWDVRHGYLEAPDADEIRFTDGTRVEWDGQSWKLKPTFTKTSTADAPEKGRRMTNAEKWLNTYIPEQLIHPINRIVFEDGTAVEWSECGYVLAPTFVKTGEANDLERGRKLDQDKPRWSLLPLHTIAQVIKVLEHGAKKYSVGNWEHVPDARTRYYDATMRHVEAWWLGEKNDPESGLPHLAHAAACLLFLMWFDERPLSADDAIVDELVNVMKRRMPRA